MSRQTPSRRHRKKKPQPGHNTSSTSNTESYPIAGLMRRLAALVYDLLLLGAIWILMSVITLFMLFDGAAPADAWMLQVTVLPVNIAATYLFYAWCWTHGGQTLGMQAWRIRTVTVQGTTLTFVDCIKRSTLGALSIALGGLGYWIALIEPNSLSLHDKLTNTRVILIPAKTRKT